MNRLATETSPYLLQHAHNPVDWYPWGEEALTAARNQDKPILVSIGYSACHWCHVMERESFENATVAAAMNEHFINIKVDREERPDVDAVYMEALQAMGLRGGWPLHVFLMPDAKPFYGGTYFPPTQWLNLVRSVHRAFREDREKLQASANGFANSLQQTESERYRLSLAEDAPDFPTPTEFLTTLQKTFDRERGGELRVPKFPMPSVWRTALHALALSPDSESAAHVRYTLTRMAIGGIYDHLAGGWTRYSTDGEWKVPHFEKMLYDNGQLLSLYAQAYQYAATNTPDDPFWIAEWAVDKTIQWLESEMLSPEGGFYAAQDADSEGEEGKYYVWTEAEIAEALHDEADAFGNEYNIYIEGNWEHGRNVLHLDKLPTREAWQQFMAWHDKLTPIRSQRIRPNLDNKLLCSWNALALTGLVDAYRAFGKESYKALALKNAHFIKNHLLTQVFTADGTEGRGLWHLAEAASTNRPKVLGFLDDYAACIEAFIGVYQITFDEVWLNEAEHLANYVIANFYDPDEQFFFYTDIQAEALIARKKELFDNVIPASNSLLAKGLYQLSLLLDRSDLQEIATTMVKRVATILPDNASWLSQWWQVGFMMGRPMAEVAFVGEAAQKQRADLDKFYYPNKIVAGTTTTSELPLLLHRTPMGEQTAIYVCFNKTCLLPVTSTAEAWKQLTK